MEHAPLTRQNLAKRTPAAILKSALSHQGPMAARRETRFA
jgi:hypothetical protein